MKQIIKIGIFLFLISCNKNQVHRYKDGCVYKGEWKDNKPKGYGVMECPSGITYKGQWDGDYHGYGILSGSNGFTCEGNWNKGILNGFAIYHYPTGGKYEGFVSDSKLDGMGTYTEINSDEDYIYVGGFKDGFFQGWASVTYTNSDIFDKYLGYFKKDEHEGIGILVYKNKKIYIGEFKKSVFDGNGIFKYPDGKTKMGLWRDGELIEQCDSCVSFPQYEKPVYRKYYEPFLNSL